MMNSPLNTSYISSRNNRGSSYNFSGNTTRKTRNSAKVTESYQEIPLKDFIHKGIKDILENPVYSKVTDTLYDFINRYAGISINTSGNSSVSHKLKLIERFSMNTIESLPSSINIGDFLKSFIYPNKIELDELVESYLSSLPLTEKTKSNVELLNAPLHTLETIENTTNRLNTTLKGGGKGHHKQQQGHQKGKAHQQVHHKPPPKGWVVQKIEANKAQVVTLDAKNKELEKKIIKVTKKIEDVESEMSIEGPKLKKLKKEADKLQAKLNQCASKHPKPLLFGEWKCNADNQNFQLAYNNVKEVEDWVSQADQQLVGLYNDVSNSQSDMISNQKLIGKLLNENDALNNPYSNLFIFIVTLLTIFGVYKVTKWLDTKKNPQIQSLVPYGQQQLNPPQMTPQQFTYLLQQQQQQIQELTQLGTQVLKKKSSNPSALSQLALVNGSAVKPFKQSILQYTLRSSANTQAGRVTKARAMATRWRSPPESSAAR